MPRAAFLLKVSRHVVFGAWRVAKRFSLRTYQVLDGTAEGHFLLAFIITIFVGFCVSVFFVNRTPGTYLYSYSSKPTPAGTAGTTACCVHLLFVVLLNRRHPAHPSVRPDPLLMLLCASS